MWEVLTYTIARTALSTNNKAFLIGYRDTGFNSKFIRLMSFAFNDTATTEIYTRRLVGSVRCV